MKLALKPVARPEFSLFLKKLERFRENLRQIHLLRREAARLREEQEVPDRLVQAPATP